MDLYAASWRDKKQQALQRLSRALAADTPVAVQLSDILVAESAPQVWLSNQI